MFHSPFDASWTTSIMVIADFGDLIAERMRVEHHALAARWFERLLDLVPVDARGVFPVGDAARSHSCPDSRDQRVPRDSLKKGRSPRIPRSSRRPENLERCVTDNARRSIRFFAEYQLLNGVLVAFVLEEIDRLSGVSHAVGVRAPCVAAESIRRRAVAGDRGGLRHALHPDDRRPE